VYPGGHPVSYLSLLVGLRKKALLLLLPSLLSFMWRIDVVEYRIKDVGLIVEVVEKA
jgi:hypothetical protein